MRHRYSASVLNGGQKSTTRETVARLLGGGKAAEVPSRQRPPLWKLELWCRRIGEIRVSGMSYRLPYEFRKINIVRVVH